MKVDNREPLELLQRRLDTLELLRNEILAGQRAFTEFNLEGVLQQVSQQADLCAAVRRLDHALASLMPGVLTKPGLETCVVNANDGTVTLTTTSGTALVLGQKSFALQTQVDSNSGLQHVFAQGVDITSTLTGGHLGGLLQARDQVIPSVLAQLDNLAAGLASAFNAQHAKGFDLSGAQGGNFFAPFVPPSAGSNAGAAANFQLAITDPSQIAASSDGSAGSNGDALALSTLQNQAIVGGQTVTGYYATLVGSIGSQAADAISQQQAEQFVVQQLQNQRASVSGVSLDEEAANLVKFQQAYDAAARVFSIVDGLTQTAIQMGAS